MPDSFERAQAAAARGLKLFPLRPGTKVPAIPEWPAKATDDREQLARWAAEFPECGWGIHCDGLLAVDVDVKNGAPGYRSLLALELANGDIPPTARQRTPSGGEHFLLRAPDAPNTAGRLGPGLDTRGRHGFVALYDLDDAPIADAPGWLRALAGRATAPREQTPATVSENPVDVQRATEYLQTCPPAIEGQAGDARTYATVCRVRDFGLPQEVARRLLLEHFNPRCMPPWEPEEIEVKLENAYRYAKNPQGVDSVQALFADLSKGTPAPAPNPGRFRRARKLADIQPPPMLVEGLIPQQAIVALGALPGRSKSEHATNLAYAIATGAPDYLGRKIAPGNWMVAYVDLERLTTTELRLALFANEDGIDPADVPVEVGGGPFRVNQPEDVRGLIADLQALERERGRKLALVVVDALGAAVAGEDSNAASAASTVGMALRAIRDCTGASVLVVAHSPKSGEETIAGSVQFDAIFDVSVFVESYDEGQTGNLHVKKDNVMVLDEADRRIGWARETLRAVVGEREVRAHRFIPALAAQAPTGGGPRGPRGPGPTEQQALAWLQNRTLSGGAASEEEWRAAIQACCPNPRTAERTVDRVIANLMGGAVPLVRRTPAGIMPADMALPP